jgi:hypothetical protein
VSVFRRRKRAEVDVEDFVDDLDPQDREYEDAELQAELEAREAEALRATRAPQRPQGPWDVADAPETELVRLDLGGLLVPVPPETEVRVDLGPDGEVVAATLVQGEGAVQVSAFAAPRSEGIWAEVAEEIQASLRSSGGQAEQQEGAFGTELAALVPTEVPGQGVAMQAARFAGVDGPRWFLRALFTGRAAVDADAAAPLEAALRDVVVVRGSEPMAVRDPLPLRLPADLPRPDEAAGEAAQDAPEQDLLPLERGPEITETR